MIEKQDSRDNSELILTLADPKRRHNDFYVVQYDMKDVGECGLCFACMPPRSILLTVHCHSRQYGEGGSAADLE